MKQTDDECRLVGGAIQEVEEINVGEIERQQERDQRGLMNETRVKIRCEGERGDSQVW